MVAHPREVRRRVGYVFGGDRGLYERLSGLDNLRYFAELYAVPPREQRARIGELLELVGLTGREKERVEGYSRGMRQRLHIARGLLHRPEVLFLDEPSIGIDPVGARELRSTVKALVEHGTTVLLTTHYMFEADELCDRIAVIAGGRIVATGTPEELKQRASAMAPSSRSRSSACPTGVVERVRRAARRALGRRRGARPGRRCCWCTPTPGADVTQPVLACLDGTRIGRVITREPTLEDAYVELVRGVVSVLRLVGVTWWLQLKMRSRSAFDGLLSLLWPLFFATTIFLMFRPGGAAGPALLSAAVGASVMGIWSATSTTASARCRWSAARARWSCSSRRPPRSRC